MTPEKLAKLQEYAGAYVNFDRDDVTVKLGRGVLALVAEVERLRAEIEGLQKQLRMIGVVPFSEETSHD